MVLHGCRIIQSTEIESLSTFNIPEVLDGKPQSILQGQTREFWWLLSLYSKGVYVISMYNSVTSTGSNDFYFEFNEGGKIALIY